MKEKEKNIDRRKFLKNVGFASLGSILISGETKASPVNSFEQKEGGEKSQFPKVPRRLFGKTGVDLPILTLGCTFNVLDHQDVLPIAFQHGVDYWDTATNYARTKSELGIGEYLKKNPGLREKLFLVSKPPDIVTPIPDIADMEKQFQASLKRLNTHYVDMYCGIHGLSDPSQLTDELKEWAEKAKKRGVIKYFGYSAHLNMAQCLAAVAKLDWVDGALISYNFHLMQDEKYQAAIDAAYDAGMGLIAIKTQRQVSMLPENQKTDKEKKLAEHFFQKGFTEGQAKLKVVIEDKRFTSASVGMGDVPILEQNMAAAMDKTKLSKIDQKVFEEYTEATRGSYCTGCVSICNSALSDMPYTGDIARYLMYCNSYGEPERARELFAQIPVKTRKRLLNIDYSLAEARCPEHIPISKLIAEAVVKLA